MRWSFRPLWVERSNPFVLLRANRNSNIDILSMLQQGAVSRSGQVGGVVSAKNERRPEIRNRLKLLSDIRSGHPQTTPTGFLAPRCRLDLFQDVRLFDRKTLTPRVSFLQEVRSFDRSNLSSSRSGRRELGRDGIDRAQLFEQIPYAFVHLDLKSRGYPASRRDLFQEIRQSRPMFGTNPTTRVRDRRGLLRCIRAFGKSDLFPLGSSEKQRINALAPGTPSLASRRLIRRKLHRELRKRVSEKKSRRSVGVPRDRAALMSGIRSFSKKGGRLNSHPRCRQALLRAVRAFDLDKLKSRNQMLQAVRSYDPDASWLSPVGRRSELKAELDGIHSPSVFPNGFEVAVQKRHIDF